MSQSLPVATEALNVDWKLVASATAVGLGTLITTIWGWFRGQRKARENASAHISNESQSIQVTGAVLQDNTSLRDNTQAVRDLRDQVFMLNHLLERHIRSNEDVTDDLRQVRDYLKVLTK